jgi:hypothetical protein
MYARVSLFFEKRFFFLLPAIKQMTFFSLNICETVFVPQALSVCGEVVYMDVKGEEPFLEHLLWYNSEKMISFSLGMHN